MKLLHLFLIAILITSLLAGVQPAEAQSPSPWGEILNPDGTIKWSNLTDMGTTTQPADWMAVTLPGGITLHPDATYHRYETPSGNVLVLPSPATLFFMALHPSQSGLTGAQSMLGDGAALLTLLVGPALSPDQLANMVKLGYTSPQDFFQAVIDGKVNIWTVMNVNFVYDLLAMSYQSGFLVNALLLYLNGSANCADIPGGCAGLIAKCPDGSCLPKPSICPTPTITQNPPTVTIQKLAPDHPLVIGQDPTRRGADIQAFASIPPVIFTWYQPVQDPPTCQSVGSGGGGCSGPGSKYSNHWDPSMEGNPAYQVVGGEIHCIKHVEILQERIINLQANAQLNGESAAWILNDLAEKYYEAYIHHPYFGLVPGMARMSSGCNGSQVCSATALASNVPFADPGTFDLKMWAYTAGTTFTWKGVTIPITPPRALFAQNAAQIYVTLVTLLPAGAP